MRLAQALRLAPAGLRSSMSAAGEAAPAPRLAFVGAGGKTTALFRLATELAGEKRRPVLVTTTTHFSIGQTSLGDRRLQVERPQDLDALEAGLPFGVTVVCGRDAEPGRVAGPGEAALERLAELARRFDAPLLVEADGSRRLPLKAPAEHEPAIPAWVDGVVVVAGLPALGLPLDASRVHRLEHFARLAGIETGEIITPAALARVLLSSQGGLKDIPPGARRIALLNGASTPELQAQSQALAGALLEGYAAALAANLDPQQAGPLAVREDEVLAAWERTAGVVLAAGGSSRLGRPKQLLPWRGRPLVRHAAETALAAGLRPVIVVTGAFAEEVEAHLEGLPVAVERNPAWAEGQGGSVAAGARRLPPETGAAIFLLADQPQATPALLRELAALHARTLSPLAAPQVDGQRGNPVLFDRVTFPELRALSGEAGGRALFSRYSTAWLPWHDASLLLDVDTEADYRRLLEVE